MRILIDTCIFIHFVAERDLLSRDVIAMLEDYDHIIIAHAITEHIPLISDDSKFEFYKKQGLDLILNKK